MTKYLKVPPRQLVISVSELNEEIVTPQQARELVRECSYQVISGCLEAYSHYQTSQILLGLLPLSANRLIDVCLPFFQHSTPVLARYILFDHKLRGIRICSSGGSEWPITRCDRAPPPAEIKKYYRQKCIAFREDEVLVGVFCLQLIRCRIGLLFMSEIMQNGSLLDIPSKYQYEVVSVVHDTPKEQGVSLNFCQRQAINKLKRLASDHLITIVLAGLRIVPSLGKYYYSKSFIAQGALGTPEQKSCLGERTDVSFLSNVNLTLSTKIERHIDFQETSITEAEIIEGLYINKSLKCYEALPEVKINPHSKLYLNEPPKEPDLILMNLWYLFKAVNLDSPFVLPYPFTRRCEQLYHKLIQLQKYALISKQKLIKIYRYKAGESQVKLQLRVYKNIEEMIESNSELFPSLIYVYTNDDEQIKTLKSSKKYGDIICNCDSLNPDADEAEPNSLNRIQKRRIEVACNRVLRERMKSIDDMLSLFMELKLSKQEIQLCFVKQLPSKIKKSVKPLPIHFFLLHANKDKIINEIGESQFRLQKQGKQKSSQAIDVDDLSFRQKVQKAAAYKIKIAGYVECHRCSIHFHKSLAHHCDRCDEWLCYECLDVLTNKILTSLEEYKCVMCSRLCRCKKCNGDHEPKPPEMQEEVVMTQPAQTGLFDASNCSICQMMDENYKQIMFECGQCKKPLCYNCERGKLVCQQQQNPIQICKTCDNFNSERQGKKNAKNIMPLLMPVNLEERWQEKQHKSNQIPPVTAGTLRASLPFPAPAPVQKPIQKAPIIQEKNTKNMQISSPLHERNPTKDKKSRKSSSSSSPPRRKRSKSKSKSSSRSRSRDRHHKKAEKDKREKYTIRRNEDKSKSKQKQKQIPFEKMSSNRTQNEQRPLWGAGSQNSSRPSFSQERHQSRESNLQTKNSYQNNYGQNNRGGYQMRDYRNSYNNNQGHYNNGNRDRNDNMNQKQDIRHESSKQKNTQNDRNNGNNDKTAPKTLIPLPQEIDYEQYSY